MLHVFIKLLIFYDEIEYLTPIVCLRLKSQDVVESPPTMNRGQWKRTLAWTPGFKQWPTTQAAASVLVDFFIVHLYEKINERHWIQSTNTHGFKQFLSYILQQTKLSTATVHVATSGVPIDLNLIKSLHIQYSS